VLFSLRPETRSLYHGLFARGEVEREYLAVAAVPAPPRQRRWRVASRVVRGHPWFRMREVPGEPNAATRLELLDWRDGLGLFRLVPETGKKHQLRLHLAGLGFPILNDRCYPVLQPEAPPDFDRPLQLLARRLAFRDPASGQRVEVESRRRLAWL
jgi:tRNA pseudouridine32 synthase/23S rRNA pseudouridine746 synthase